MTFRSCARQGPPRAAFVFPVSASFAERCAPETGRSSTALRVAVAAVLCAGTAAWSCASAQATETGRNLAAACTSCHGGGARNALAALAGRQKGTLVRQLQDFRSGKTSATVMQQIAKGYTDEQIDALSAYFAAQTAD